MVRGDKEVSIVLKHEIKRQAKAAAALEGKTLRAWIPEALGEKLARRRTRYRRVRRVVAATPLG